MDDVVRVRRVIDGDTIELDRPDPTGTYPFERVRLMRVVAPELDDRSPNVRAVAYAAARFLRRLAVDRDAIIRGETRDKFHRRLARVDVLIPGDPAAGLPPEPHDVEALLVAAGLAQWWSDVVRQRAIDDRAHPKPKPTRETSPEPKPRTKKLALPGWR